MTESEPAPPPAVGSDSRVETLAFGSLTVQFDQRVLRPRPWTLAQSLWAAELDRDLPDGPVLELCAGVGHIGLMLASLVGRDLVQVDADDHACEYARANAVLAGLDEGVEVRHGAVDAMVEPDERFALIIADPPWVPSHETARFPDDPLSAIDGGGDGLALARVCVEVAGRHLAPGGASLLQLRDTDQVAGIDAYLQAGDGIGLQVAQVRDVQGANGVLVKLASCSPR